MDLSTIDLKKDTTTTNTESLITTAVTLDPFAIEMETEPKIKATMTSGLAGSDANSSSSRGVIGGAVGGVVAAILLLLIVGVVIALVVFKVHTRRSKRKNIGRNLVVSNAGNNYTGE